MFQCNVYVNVMWYTHEYIMIQFYPVSSKIPDSPVSFQFSTILLLNSSKEEWDHGTHLFNDYNPYDDSVFYSLI